MKAPLLALALAFLVVLIVFSGLVEAKEYKEKKIEFCVSNFRSEKIEVRHYIDENKQEDAYTIEPGVVDKCKNTDDKFKQGSYTAKIKWKGKDSRKKDEIEKTVVYDGYYKETVYFDVRENKGTLQFTIKKPRDEDYRYETYLYANGDKISSTALSRGEWEITKTKDLKPGYYDFELKWENKDTGSSGSLSKSTTMHVDRTNEETFKIEDNSGKYSGSDFNSPAIQSTEPPRIISHGTNGNTINRPGDTITLEYTINNPGKEMKISLGATIIHEDGTTPYSDPPNDRDDTLKKGNEIKLERNFRIPSNAKPGRYKIMLGIYKATFSGLLGEYYYSTTYDITVKSSSSSSNSNSNPTTPPTPQPIFQNPWITGSDSFIVQNLKEGGDKITFYYTINNPNSYNIDTTLGATIKHEDGTEYYDEGNDRDVTLKYGTNDVSRYFVISSKVKPGKYNYLLGIHKAHMAGEWGYTSLTNNYPITVISPSRPDPEIVSATWSKPSVNKGDTVYMVVDTKGIPVGSYIEFEFFEDDLVFNDPIGKFAAYLPREGGVEYSINDKNKLYADSVFGPEKKMELFYKVKVAGLKKTSNNLKVTRDCGSNDFDIVGMCIDIPLLGDCLGTTDDVTLGSVGTNLACNVIPIIELGPDAIDTGKCLFNNNKDGWDNVFCDLTYAGSMLDVGSNGALILSAFGGPAIIGGIAIEGSTGILDGGINLLRIIVKNIKKTSLLPVDAAKSIWKFIKSIDNLRLLAKVAYKISDKDTIIDLFKIIWKDSDTSRDILKKIIDNDLSGEMAKALVKIGKFSVDTKIAVKFAGVSAENLPRLVNMFENGKLQEKITKTLKGFGADGDIKTIEFSDYLDKFGFELGAHHDGIIKLPLKHSKFSYTELKDIIIKNVIPHEIFHGKLRKVLDTDHGFKFVDGVKFHEDIEEFLADMLPLKYLAGADKVDFIEDELKTLNQLLDIGLSTSIKAYNDGYYLELVRYYTLAKSFGESVSGDLIKLGTDKKFFDIVKDIESRVNDVDTLRKLSTSFSSDMDVLVNGLGTSSKEVQRILKEITISKETNIGKLWPFPVLVSTALLGGDTPTIPQPEIKVLDAPSNIKSDEKPKIKVAFVNNGTDAQSGSITVNVENVADLKIISHDTTEIKTNVVGSSISVEAKEAGWASSEEKTLELELKPKDVSKDIKITLSSEADGIKFNDGKPLEPVIQIKSVEDALSPKEPVQPRTCIADDFDFKWSACVNGWQTGIYTKKIGSDCVNGEPDNAKQVCIYTPQQPEPAIPTTSSPTPAPSKQPATEPIKSELDLDKKMCVLSGGNVGSIFSGINDGAIYTKSECLQKFKSLVLDGGRLTCGLTIDNRPKITYRNVEWGGMIIQEDYCPLQDLSITKTDNQNQQSVGGGPIVSQQSTLQSASQPAQTPQLTPKQVQYGGKAKVKIYNSRSAVYRVKMDIMKDNAVVMTENLENKAFFETDWIDLDIGKYTVTVEWENKENGLKYKEKQELIIKNGMSRIAIFDIKDVLKKQEIVQQSQIEKLPDLIIEEIKLKKTTVKSGSYIPIQFAVKNVGEAAAKNIKLRISYLDSSIEKVLPEMQPGGFVMVLELIKLSAIGSYKIDVNVDPDNNIIESREDNKESVEVSVI